MPQVRDFMSTDLHTLGPDDTIQIAAQSMKRHNVGSIPVCQGNALLGVITDRDIAIGCVASGGSPMDHMVRDYMTAPPITIGPDDEVEAALACMAEAQVRRLPVVDRDGGLLGMIAMGDIAAQREDTCAVGEALASISQPVRV